MLLGRRTDIPAIMSLLDIHVLSSLGEAFPNVLAEAMACGTPCVTTNVGDAALIVGETGWVVPPQNSAVLASALEQALAAIEQPESWSERCTHAQLRIEENFSIETMVNAYHTAWGG
jgi:glycosyltransferase involved in cell wall biosynthesis